MLLHPKRAGVPPTTNLPHTFTEHKKLRRAWLRGFLVSQAVIAGLPTFSANPVW